MQSKMLLDFIFLSFMKPTFTNWFVCGAISKCDIPFGNEMFLGEWKGPAMCFNTQEFYDP